MNDATDQKCQQKEVLINNKKILRIATLIALITFGISLYLLAREPALLPRETVEYYEIDRFNTLAKIPTSYIDNYQVGSRPSNIYVVESESQQVLVSIQDSKYNNASEWYDAVIKETEDNQAIALHYKILEEHTNKNGLNGYRYRSTLRSQLVSSETYGFIYFSDGKEISIGTMELGEDNVSAVDFIAENIVQQN